MIKISEKEYLNAYIFIYFYFLIKEDYHTITENVNCFDTA